MKFHAWGHPNVRAKHKTTIEFTKDEHLTPEGDCIIGVRADFDAQKLKAFVKEHSFVKITVTAGRETEVIHAKTNPEFDDEHEFVIRMGEHPSKRTFAVRADKSAKYLSRELIKCLQEGKEIEVHLEKAVE